jgi:putative transposase
VAADLKRIYTCATAEEAGQRPSEFEAKWDEEYLPIGQSWRRNWPRLIPFFDYPPEIRKVIYTTNAIESVNMSLRNIGKKWTMPIRDWKAALNRFTIQFEERLPQR